MDRGTSSRRAPPTGRNSFIMRILHIVKTSGGAAWAALEAAELARLGVEVHVAVPAAEGSSMRLWEEAAAKIHIASLDYPATSPWRLPSVCSRARAIVASVKPDVIHTHHVGPTLVMRHALGRSHSIPRVFQVPGPLHLEHWLYRTWDLAVPDLGPGVRGRQRFLDRFQPMHQESLPPGGRGLWEAIPSGAKILVRGMEGSEIHLFSVPLDGSAERKIPLGKTDRPLA